MKSTGMTRRMDDLGRIVLPIEIRRTMEVTSGDLLEIYVEDDGIILKKYGKSCVFCGAQEDLKEYSDHWVCAACRNKLSSL